jgi:protein required for attachment to host cells
MKIAEYFASLSIQVSKQDQKKVDTFLGNIEKGLKGNVKGTNDLEKAVKKETKTTVDGLVQKEQKTKALNKQVTVAAKNQRAWNKEFAYSLKMMTSKPLSKSALKAQQGVYDQLFGAVAPKAMMGATGANQRAWNTRFKQQLQGMSAGGSGISRKARQEQLNAAFGAVGSNPRLANMLNQRLGHLGRGKSDTLSDMAAYYRNEEKVANLKERVMRQEEQATSRILALRQRELAREERTRQRMAVRDQRASEIHARNAAKARSVGRVSTGGYSPSQHSFSAYSGHVLSNRMGIGYGVLPAPVLAAAAPLAAGVAVQQGSVALGNNQALRERQRVQLDIASGESSRYGKDFSSKRFFELSNQLGVEAEPMIDPYAKFMKQMLTQGRSTDEAFGIYKDMSIATRSAGLGQVQMERQAYALQQIFGLGYAQADELNRQLVDANPAMLGYIRKEYAKQTGKDETTFKDAVSNREISSQLIIDAYKTAAAAGMGRVQEFSSTVLADQARLTNVMLEEQMSRTLSDEVIPSMREYVQAQKEMYEAMKPFRDSMYEAAASVLSFSAAALNFATLYTKKVGEMTQDSPAIRELMTNPMWLIPDNPITMALKYGGIANDAMKARRPEAPPTMSGIDFLRRSKESFMGGSQTQVMVQPGAFVINTQASNAEEVGKFTVHYFQTQLDKTLMQNPNTGG